MATVKKVVGVGLGVAALTAIGLYFLRGERGAKTKTQVRGWALKMKGEVLEKIESMKSIKRDTYLDMVDKVASRYAGKASISAAELQHLTVELKNAWVQIDKKLK